MENPTTIAGDSRDGSVRLVALLGSQASEVRARLAAAAAAAREAVRPGQQDRPAGLRGDSQRSPPRGNRADPGQIEKVNEQLEAVARAVPLVERLETIPGVGVLNATALSSMTGDFSRYPSGRHFASSLGLTPKEHSSGLRRRLGAISKRGDTYLRTLLIAGARSVLLSAHRTERPAASAAGNRAAIAVANKLARIVWAVATRGDGFCEAEGSPEHVPV